MKGCNIGEVIDQGHECAERRDKTPKGEIGEGFTECRETSVGFSVDDSDTKQAEAVDIVETSHPVAGFGHSSEGVLHRTDVSEEMGLGSRVDDVVHPSLIVTLVYRD